MNRTAKKKAPAKTGPALTVKIKVDSGEVIAGLEELTALLDSLEGFRESLLHDLKARFDQNRLCRIGKSTFRTGHLACRLETTRDAKRFIAALRALRVADAHKILKG